MRPGWVLAGAVACAPGPQSEPEQVADRPSIVIVALDNVRWDHTSLAGGDRDTTPHLAALAESPGAVSLDRMHAAASFSLASYASLFTGQDAVAHGLGFSRTQLAPGTRTLAGVLGLYGYRSAAFAEGGHLSPEFGLLGDFDTAHTSPVPTGLGVQVEQALTWLEGLGPDPGPTLLFVHGNDAHLPYTTPEEIGERFAGDYSGPVHDVQDLLTTDGLRRIAGDRYWVDHTGPRRPAWGQPPPHAQGRYQRYDPTSDANVALSPGDLAHIADHYDAAVWQADQALGSFLQDPRAQPVLDQAIVVVLSDHGEALGEQGYFRHGEEAGAHLFHVVTVVRLPGSEAPPRRHTGLATQLDLTPTLLELAGIRPLADIQGQSLGPGLAHPGHDVVAAAAESHYWVRGPDHTLHGELRPDQDPIWQLYTQGREPHQGGAPLRDTDPAAVAPLQARVADWPDRRSSGAKDRSRVPPGATEKLKRSLQQAGYWWAEPEAEPAGP